eukprot:1192597-Prorocentrum_minimum.AAC.3
MLRAIWWCVYPAGGVPRVAVRRGAQGARDLRRLQLHLLRGGVGDAEGGAGGVVRGRRLRGRRRRDARADGADDHGGGAGDVPDDALWAGGPRPPRRGVHRDVRHHQPGGHRHRHRRAQAEAAGGHELLGEGGQVPVCEHHTGRGRASHGPLCGVGRGLGGERGVARGLFVVLCRRLRRRRHHVCHGAHRNPGVSRKESVRVPPP